MAAEDFGLMRVDPREKQKAVESWLKEHGVRWEFRYIPKNYVNVPVQQWRLHFDVTLTRGNNHHTFTYVCGLGCVGAPKNLLFAAQATNPTLRFLKDAGPLSEFDLNKISLKMTNPRDYLYLLYDWLCTPLRFENMYPAQDTDNPSKLSQIRRKRLSQFGVGPEISDLIRCLISDGRTVTSVFSFEEWADELGYDKDSRSHESIYNDVRSQTSKFVQIISQGHWDGLMGLMGE